MYNSTNLIVLYIFGFSFPDTCIQRGRPRGWIFFLQFRNGLFGLLQRISGKARLRRLGLNNTSCCKIFWKYFYVWICQFFRSVQRCICDWVLVFSLICCFNLLTPHPTIAAPTPSPTTSSCDDNTCIFAFDGDCDDGGPGADYSCCAIQTDCFDCCNRNPSRPDCPPPTPSPTTNYCDDNTCRYAFDGDCDDGGPGADYSCCPIQTDCFDCCDRNPSRPDCSGEDLNWYIILNS